MQRPFLTALVMALFSAVLLNTAWSADKADKSDKAAVASKKAAAQTHEGTVVEAGNSKIKLLENQKEELYDVSPNATIKLEGTLVGLDRIPVGRHAKLTLGQEESAAGPVGPHLVTAISVDPQWYRTGSAQILITLAVLIVPFVIGNQISRSVRMPEHGWKIGLVLFSAIFGVVVTLMNWPPALGIDLKGGVNLVYEVDRSKLGQNETVNMKDMIDAINLRVNKGGQKEVVVRKYGEDRVEVVIPNTNPADVAEIKRILVASGALEFRILADRHKHQKWIDLAAAERDVRTVEIKDPKTGEVKVKWVEMDPKVANSLPPTRVTTRQRAGKAEVLVAVTPANETVTGADLSYSAAGMGDNLRPCVNFGFNAGGSAKFGVLTGENLPDIGGKYFLGIVLDNVLLSAPTINSKITDRGQITGDFTEEQVRSLIQILQAGKLPATLTKDAVSERTIDPLLGADTIKKANLAMIISCIAVPLFMIFYYRFLGVIATITTVLNMTLVIGLMLAIHAAFTLTGLAALALTVGMAVDASVLIFERMREETERGASIRMVIRNSFERALSTIIDSNVTTLIAATVLYVVGTDQVKGFAVALWLGVAINVFTATFCNRVMFDIAEKIGLFRKAKMMHLFGVTNFDFMSARKLAIGGTLILNVVGLLAFVSLGKKGFDIDFTGGSSVEVLFKKEFAKENSAVVAAKLPGLKEKDLSVTGTRLEGETAGIRWRVMTSEQKLDLVLSEIKQAFGNELEVLKMDVSDVKQIAQEDTTKKELPKLTPETPKTPETPPADTKKTEEKPAEEKKPDAVKPAEEKKQEETKPAEKRAEPEAKAEEKKADAEKPAENKQSSRTSPGGWRFAPLALHGVLYQDDAKKAEDKPAEAKTETKPADEKKADDKKADEKKADSKTDAKTELPQLTPRAETPLAPFAPAATPDLFAGGTSAKLKFSQAVSMQDVQKYFKTVLSEKEFKDDFAQVRFDVRNPAHDGYSQKPFTEWEVRLNVAPESGEKLIKRAQQLAQEPNFANADSFGPQVADKTQWQTTVALVASWALIIAYVWFRFQRVAYGLAAVLALIHDVFITIGFMAFAHYLNAAAPALGQALLLQDFKVNLTIVAAILTIIGYSVNDTIVVFDRIREVKGKMPYVTDKIVNDSVNQTLSRTVLTAFTVFLVAFILYVFGGEGVRAFSFCMLVGVFTGCFSSIYVAAPLLVWLERLGRSHVEKAHMAEHGTAKPIN